MATKENGGLDDVVSDVFGRTATFTIVELERLQIKKVKVLQNSAAFYQYGAGPIAVKLLIDEGVDIIMAGEFGLGASTLLEQHKISKIKIQQGTLVKDAIKQLKHHPHLF